MGTSAGVAEWPVDVMVLDIMMPKMDGYHLLREAS
jgi:CheY-like chemotaxis protein